MAAKPRFAGATAAPRPSVADLIKPQPAPAAPAPPPPAPPPEAKPSSGPAPKGPPPALPPSSGITLSPLFLVFAGLGLVAAGLAGGWLAGAAYASGALVTCENGARVADPETCRALQAASSSPPAPREVFVCATGERVQDAAACPPVPVERVVEEKTVYVCADGTRVLDAETCQRLAPAGDANQSRQSLNPSQAESYLFRSTYRDIEKAARAWLANDALALTLSPLDNTPRYVYQEGALEVVDPATGQTLTVYDTFLSISRDPYDGYLVRRWPVVDGERVLAELNEEQGTLKVQKNCRGLYAFLFTRRGGGAQALAALRDRVVQDLKALCPDPVP